MPKRTAKYIFLSRSELEKKSTKHLLHILKTCTAKISSISHYAGLRCCEICHEYIGDDWENDVGKPMKPFKQYKSLIKNILKDREHIRRYEHVRK